MKKLINTRKSTKNFRTLSVICACAVVLTSGAGCSINVGQSADDAQQPAVSSAAEETVSSAAAETEKVGVPKVEGLSVDNAKDILNKAGFQYEVQEDSTSTEKDGTVISQFPVAGDKIEKGSKVTIIVARPEKEEAAAPAASEPATEPAVVESNNDSNIVNTPVPPQITAPAPTPSKTAQVGFENVYDSGHLDSETVSGVTYTYGPNNVLNNNGKCWAENKSGVGKWAYVAFSSFDAVSVSGIGIWNGYDGTSDQFYNNGRVTKVRVTTDNDSFDFYLNANTMGEQYFGFGATVYTHNLKITILDAIKGDKYDDTCISEIVPYQ